MSRPRLTALAAALAAAAVLGGAAPAAGVVSPSAQQATTPARTPAHTPAARRPGPVAATTPALGIAGATLAPVTPSASGAADEEGGGTPGGDGNWLADNGLTSPQCAHSKSPSCRASGTVTIPAAPGHYAFDTWTKGGTLGTPTWNAIISSVLGFIWSLIVQITVAVFSILEWAMSFNLTDLGSGALSRVHLVNDSWGMPIAAVMLAIGGIWVATQTFSTRKIGGALSSVAAGFLTMGVSLAIISSPAATIGQLTNMTAELGRAAASAPLAIAAPNTSLDDGMKQTWQVVVERPFSLLEFGDTGWGTDPAQRDPKLRAAARDIARKQGPDVLARVNAAETNAGIFAVWGSNSDERNSRKKDKCEGGPCLLNVMCGGEEDLDHCKGSMARYVKARTDAGVTSRFEQVPMVALGMLSIWIIFGAIVAGLLWSFLSIFKNLIALSYLWVLALTFKPELRRKTTELLLDLLGSAIALILFGVLAGVAITTFLIIQSLGLPWAEQWVLSIIALIGLFLERKKITDLLGRLLSQPQQATGGVGGFAGRLASSYATGLGLSAIRGARRPAGTAIGAGAGMGGGVPTDLPTGAKAGEATQNRPGRMQTAAAILGGGLVGGPIGSAALAGALHRGTITDGAKTAAATVKGAATNYSGSVTDLANRASDAAWPLLTAASSAGRAWNEPPTAGIATPDQQVAAVLAAQQQARIQRAAAAAEQLPAARELALERLSAYGNAARAHLSAPQEPKLAAIAQYLAMDAGYDHARAEDRVRSLEGHVQAGETAQAWDPGDRSSAPAQRAAAWLDTQAQTPAGKRPYRQLAGIHGVSPQQWDGLGEEHRTELRGAIDDALAVRTPAPVSGRPSALEALGHVASGQSWWHR